MNAIVSCTAVCSVHSGSAVDSAASAGMQCLGAAGVDPGDVSVLINVGVYRENNIMEPSVAALIQQKMELNPDPAKNLLQQRTLSYDLMSGATGFLNAALAGNSLLQTGAARHVLIVAADLHPAGRWPHSFPFSTLGAAVLLQSAAEPGSGFGAFQFRTAAMGDPVGYRSQGAVKDFGCDGRSHGVIELDPEWVDRLETFAVATGRDFLQKQRIAPGEIDILVAPQIEAGLPDRLARQLGLRADCISVDLHPQWGDPHTAAPGACLHQLIQDGHFTPGKTVLFLSVGSGVSAGCALYRI